MRVASALSLALLASSMTLAAERPIPQDHARMEARFREALEWNRKTLQGAYDRVGKKDPRWDKPAAEALELFARKGSDQHDPPIKDSEINLAAKKAVDAGCGDPLILFLYANSSRANYPGLEEYTRRLRVAAEAMQKSAYPPIRRAFALLVHLDIASQDQGLTPEGKRDVQRRLDSVFDLLPKSLAEDPRGEPLQNGWYGISLSAIAIQKRLASEPKAAFDRIDFRLAKVKDAEALRLKVKGHFFVSWAWDARGTGYANTVSDEQFRVFSARLAEARRSLERAWELDPAGVTIPNDMVRIELGIGGGDREAMEKWFDRAMRVSANDANACLAKLNWLEPKWYGDPKGEEIVAFGRACAATKNWHTGIILLGVEAHYRLYQYMDPSEWKGYLSKPEVWADFEAVYPEYLKHRPIDNAARSRYAMACYLSGHLREAHEQFQILGNRLAEWRNVPRFPLAELKKAREEAARFVEDQKK